MQSDPLLEAQEAGLRYTTDTGLGIVRRKAGKGFVYVKPDGTKCTDSRTLARIQGLVIPPAWTDVWICSRANGHLQATGRDSKGRKQAIYHPDWRATRDAHKFDRLAEFGQALPSIRKTVKSHLGLHGLSKNRILATVVDLLEHTLIRIGNRQYAEANGSFGLTTFSADHIEVTTSKLRFQFKGKSGKFHDIEHRDTRLCRVVRRCQELPGQALFQYLGDEGEPHAVTSADVNQYLQEVSGGPFTAKDFRTWGASVETLRLIRESDPQQRKLNAIVKQVAANLGNTPAVAKAAYIHPRLLDVSEAERPWETEELPEDQVDGLNGVEQVFLQHLLLISRPNKADQ